MQTVSYEKAVNFYNKGNYAKARSHLDKVIKGDNRNARAIFLKGQIAYMERKDLDFAETLIEKAISLQPDIANYYLCLVVIYSETKKYDEAINLLTRCLELFPNETKAMILLADMYRLKRDYERSYPLYQLVDDLGELPPLGRLYIMECLEVLQRTEFDAGIEKNIISFLNDESLGHDRFTKYISKFLKNKYCLDKSDNEVGLEALLLDELFLRVLRQIHISDPDLELFITQLRKEILLCCLESSGLPNSWLNLVVSVSWQCFNSEYVYFQDDEETVMVDALEEHLEILLAQESLSIEQINCATLVLSLYQLPHETRVAGLLLSLPLKLWPEQSRNLIQTTLHDIQDEIERAQTMPELTTINDATSQAVRSQYEANPYPRWFRLNDVDQEISMHRQVRIESTSQAKLPEFLNQDTLNILIAGCGSGKQPLQIALAYPETEILAIDLSRRSLAYAQRMAERYRIKNVRFLQADILELKQLKEKFHIIHCTGVLHHMHDPMKGWRVLRQLLLPRGLMKIGLYSETARQSITLIRSLIQENGINTDTKSIRSLRRRIIQNQHEDINCDSVLKSGDFYSLSSCRDLLFHVQEHCFTIPQLKTSLQQLDLRFMGFQAVVEQIYTDYSRMFPEDQEMIDLDNWCQYEQNESTAFKRMYQFWCQSLN